MILAKNLPAGTLAAELQEVFSRFGSLGRVLLPEGGITAIVEFLEPLEARKAFRHLAYSKVWPLILVAPETPRARAATRLAWPLHTQAPPKPQGSAQTTQAPPKPLLPLGACCPVVI